MFTGSVEVYIFIVFCVVFHLLFAVYFCGSAATIAANYLHHIVYDIYS